MPEISRFYGIIIRMWVDDHPRPHFHAWYSGYQISVRIADGTVTGDFPRPRLALIQQWLNLHREELYQNWGLLRENKLPRYIDPLD